MAGFTMSLNLLLLVAMVSEERLITLLEQINSQTSKQTKVTIQRRRGVFDD
ncbi:hypothetical protein F2Q70_00021233 [Brassica cretica]|uniref:Uncharacterized protein n=1 Tax=Brassica cretica TaxID=69181 RepID=A0A8S9GLI7_BRACR|nr:hypothetical protein F2Q70_00021233 [Brassica cretica]